MNPDGARSLPRSLLPRARCALLLPLLLTLSASAATLTNAPVLPHAASDLGASLLRTLGALAMVIALFLGGAWLFRNWQRLALRPGQNPQLHVLEVRHLGQRHALYVVGYHDQRMLLAASPTGVSLVSHLPHGEPLSPPMPAAPTSATPVADFTAALQQALQVRSQP